jgi:DNA-directed RNA polymerase subunit RPC12/RpoP
VYDNKVKNSRHVRVGDLAVVQDSDYVLGAGWIDSIEVTPQAKIRYRCPHCENTDIKKRGTKQPAYWCSACHRPFDAPVEEQLDVETYTADYSRTFKFSDRYFPAKALDSAFVANAKQNSIRELDATQLRPLLEQNFAVSEPWWDAQVREDEQIAGGHTVGLCKNRIGQQRFREALLARYGEACAFTGPQPPAILEAAHLLPYNENPEHEVRAGLLLRRDLHTLFDDFLITINPDNWSIQVAPELMKFSDLAKLNGRPVRLKQDLRPWSKYIQDHATIAHAEWKRRSAASSASYQPSNP